MIALKFAQREDYPLKVLCLGAHSDDIEIGCGGTILKLVENYKKAVFHWVVFSSGALRKQEAEASASAFLASIKQKEIELKNFRDGFFPYCGNEIKEYFEKLKRVISPDVILTHYRLDLHQDHRLISELTWNSFRDHWILEYEVPKYDGDLGQPNLFVHLDESTCTRKIKYLLNYFKSQHDNQWFSQETFRSLLWLRGVESNAPERYAEGYYCRKVIF